MEPEQPQMVFRDADAGRYTSCAATRNFRPPVTIPPSRTIRGRVPVIKPTTSRAKLRVFFTQLRARTVFCNPLRTATLRLDKVTPQHMSTTECANHHAVHSYIYEQASDTPPMHLAVTLTLLTACSEPRCCCRSRRMATSTDACDMHRIDPMAGITMSISARRQTRPSSSLTRRKNS
jgi:hypothetical protein